MALTELQQQRLQVCENNWVKKIARVYNEGRQAKNGGVKGRDGSAEELDTERLVRSRLQWAGHLERMADDSLPKRVQSYLSTAGGDEGAQG